MSRWGDEKRLLSAWIAEGDDRSWLRRTVEDALYWAALCWALVITAAITLGPWIAGMIWLSRLIRHAS